MGEHKLMVWRYQRGRSNSISGAGGMSYGTAGRCSCGWAVRHNVAPSKGGRKQVERDHSAHLGELADDYWRSTRCIVEGCEATPASGPFCDDHQIAPR